jgi:U3 small nucleolar RNA-associated protein 12
LIAVQTTERTVEVLRLRTEEEIRKKAARRRKREKEKRKDGAADVNGTADKEATWKDRLASWIIIRTPGKIRSFDFGTGNQNLKAGDVTIMTALANNAVEVWQLPPQPTKSSKKGKKGGVEDGGDATAGEETEATRLHALELPGHRTDVRTLSLSSDDALLASGSNGSLKVWNVKTTKCVRTMECGYSICSAFLPGDRHIVVGTKSGDLMLYDVGSSTLLETFSAHSSEIWGVCVRPDGKGLVSGGADKDVKFWDFEIKDVVINADEKDAPPVRMLPHHGLHNRLQPV